MPHFNIFIPHLQILRTMEKNVLCTKNLFLFQSIGVQLVPADFNGIRILLSLYLEIERGEKRDGEKPFFAIILFKPYLEFG